MVSRSDVDDTPAKTARVNKNDIVLKANCTILGTVEQLIDVVTDAGDDDQPVSLTRWRLRIIRSMIPKLMSWKKRSNF